VFLLISLLLVAVAYEAALSLNRVANLTTSDPRPYSSPTSK
jgi:hypothetical protein